MPIDRHQPSPAASRRQRDTRGIKADRQAGVRTEVSADPEVAEFHLPIIVNQDVARLDVSMDVVFVVQIGQSPQHLVGDARQNQLQVVDLRLPIRGGGII